jgi:ABC-type branched-subunit amino acid transport system substrate-binding protein
MGPGAMGPPLVSPKGVIVTFLPSLSCRVAVRQRLNCGALVVPVFAAALLILSACESSRVGQPSPDSQIPPPYVDRGKAIGDAERIPPATEISPMISPGVIGVPLDGSVRVGLLLPLSGRHARVGQALLNAAQLALFDIADENFSLIVRDTRGTEDGAVAAVRSALDEGARLILGPLFSTSVPLASLEASRYGVTVVSFSNNREVAGPNTFIMGLTPAVQVQRMVDYASRQGLRRYAVLAPDTPYGISIVTAFQDAVADYGAELSRVIFYPADAQDMTAEVRALASYDSRVAALDQQRRQLEGRTDDAARQALARLETQDTFGPPDFDAVLVPEGGKKLLTLAPLLAYYDVDPSEVRYIGTTLWDDPGLRNEAVLQGSWYVAPAPESWTVFRQRYQEAFGGNPPRIAALGYDATALAAVLARSAVDTTGLADFGSARLTQPGGFSGVDGIFRFLPNGEVERALAVIEIRRDGSQVLEPAPQTFEFTGF